MSESAPHDLGWLLLFLALQTAVYIACGEAAARLLAGFSALRARLFEVALLLGLPAYALVAAPFFLLSGDARAMAPAAAALCLAVFWRTRHENALPASIESYRDFRASRFFPIALALAIAFTLLVGCFRLPWLAGWTNERGIIAGTQIFDDARTLGLPLSLAAHGFPARSPLAVDMGLPYPLGAFLYPSSILVWIPQRALPLLLAGCFVEPLYYALAALSAAGCLFGGRAEALLVTASAAASTSFNWWLLNPDPKSAWFDRFFGYYKWSGNYTTIAWTPFFGLLWIANHALGFAALLTAVIWFVKDRTLRVPTALVGFAAFTSLDMTVLALLSAGLLLAIQVIRRRLTPAPVLLCAVAATVVVGVNLPSLTGQVDSNYTSLFEWTTNIWYSTGMLISTTGGYLLLLAIRPPRWTPWLAPLAVGLVFCLTFEYHTIWFWRFCFASHTLLAILCARQMGSLIPQARRFYAVAWTLLLIPGAIQASVDLASSLRFGFYATPERAALLRWIPQNTALNARVVEYRAAEASLAPDVNLLRTGNRAGLHVYDRSHALTGYIAYRRRLQDLAAGLLANDFILIPADQQPLGALLDACGATAVVSNPAGAIHAMNHHCREKLRRDEGLRARIQKIEFDAWTHALAQRPSDIDLIHLKRYLKAKPEQAHLIRPNIETLWRDHWYRDAAALLEPVIGHSPHTAEATYLYALTLHLGKLDLRRAVAMYGRALDEGFAEFWVRFNRGSALLELNERERARADLERALELNASHRGARQLLIRLQDR